jgi:hypothetical protein
MALLPFGAFSSRPNWSEMHTREDSNILNYHTAGHVHPQWFVPTASDSASILEKHKKVLERMAFGVSAGL